MDYAFPHPQIFARHRKFAFPIPLYLIRPEECFLRFLPLLLDVVSC